MKLNEQQKQRVLATWRATGRKWDAIARVGPRRREAARRFLEDACPETERPVYIGGRVEAAVNRQVDRDRSGVQRFLLTCAQNNTYVHDQVWASLKALAEYYGATLLVGRVMYDASVNRHLTKTQEDTVRRTWFDPRLEPHFVDCDLQLAPDLVWKGSMNVIPSARNPLASLEGIGRGASAVIPHTQVAMESIGRMHDREPVFLYTTGAVTQAHYIARKTGQLAEFHHSYGGLLVELLPDDTWWARQVLASNEGVICDLDIRADGGTVTSGNRAETLVVGDLHLDEASLSAMDALWEAHGLAALVRPRLTCLHDALDMHRRSHHDGPMDKFLQMEEGREDVREEVHNLARFVRGLGQEGYPCVLVGSNHLEHLVRWLDEADPWRTDPRNARYWMEANLARMSRPRVDASAVLFDLALADTGGWRADMGPAPWVNPPDRSLVRLGVEHALHGHRGRNGARGSPANLAKLAVRVTVGHSHTASIRQGVYTAGTTSQLKMSYNRDGPTAWSHSHVLLTSNGKRAILTQRAGRLFAPRNAS